MGVGLTRLAGGWDRAHGASWLCVGGRCAGVSAVVVRVLAFEVGVSSIWRKLRRRVVDCAIGVFCGVVVILRFLPCRWRGEDEAVMVVSGFV